MAEIVEPDPGYQAYDAGRRFHFVAPDPGLEK